MKALWFQAEGPFLFSARNAGKKLFGGCQLPCYCQNMPRKRTFHSIGHTGADLQPLGCVSCSATTEEAPGNDGGKGGPKLKHP